jgi:hypothetical protein
MAHKYMNVVSVKKNGFNNLKTNKIMKQTSQNLEEKQEKFEQAVRPLMKYLAENHHPHTSVYVTSRTAELLEGQKCLSTNEYLVD